MAATLCLFGVTGAVAGVRNGSFSLISSPEIAHSASIRSAKKSSLSSSRQQLGFRPSAVVTEALADVEKVDENNAVSEDVQTENSSFNPNAFEIHSLLMELCDETNVAEVAIKVGDFKLHVKRNVSAVASVYAAPAPAASYSVAEAQEDPVPSASPPPPPSASEKEASTNEGFVFVKSPKVGVFRRGRFYKGKQGRPVATQGADVKAGQIVGYIEQLSTQISIESPCAGEIADFLIEDGEPVGYDDSLISIRPSFPGIKKLS